MKYRQTSSALAALCSCMNSCAAEPVKAAQVLDVSLSRDRDDQILITALQGIVNKVQPRLFLKTHFWVCPAADDAWQDYLAKEKGLRFDELGGLDMAVQHYAKQGLIKGLTLYDPGDYGQACVATMLASRRGLLPVSERMLKYQSELLRKQWLTPPANLATGVWRDFFAYPKKSDQGLVITTSRKHDRSGAEIVLPVDPVKTPFVEITVAKVTGQWALQVNPHSINDLYLVEPNDKVGTFRADLRKVMTKPCQRALLRVRSMTEANTSVTVTSIRLLGADGQVVPTAAPVRVPCFDGLKVVEDLRGRFKTTQEAFDWSMQEFMPGSSKRYCFHMHWNWAHDVGLDLAVAADMFVFRDPFKETKTGWNVAPPRMRSAMAKMQQPAYMLGWRDSEWINVAQLSSVGGAMLCAGAPNLSFLRHIRPAKPVVMPKARCTSGPLKEKYYVAFLVGDGDTPKNLYGFHSSRSCWLDKERGSVPIAWGVPSSMVDFMPAVLEYYATTASPVDGFFAGPTGAGYAYPSLMPDRAAYGADSRRTMAQLGLGTVDTWDVFYRQYEKLHAAFNAGKQAPVDLYAAPIANTPTQNLWLKDGTPVVVVGGKGNDTLWCWGNIDAKEIARRIEAAAAEAEPPFFIIQYGHITPKRLAEAAAMLPKDRFDVVAMGDIERLAAEAGAFTATPTSLGIAPGGSVDVELTVRNPGNRFDQAGKLTLDLPTGWSASQTTWDIEPVPAASSRSRTITLTAPADLDVNAKFLRIPIRDSRAPWRRMIRLNIFAESATVADFKNLDGWRQVNGGTLSTTNGVGRFHGTHNGQTVDRAITIDFSRQPVLELSIPYETCHTKWSVWVTDGRQSLRLGDASHFGVLQYDLNALGAKWTGRRQLKLIVSPHNLGNEFEMNAIRLFHRKPGIGE